MPHTTLRPRLLGAALAAALGSASFAQTATTATTAAPSEGTRASPAQAAQHWDLPAGPLGDTLARIARQSGGVLSADPALLRGKTAPAVRGSFGSEEAAQRALAGSGLELRRLGGNALTVLPASAPAGPAPAPAGSSAAERSLGTVTVEGSRDPNLLYQPFAGGQVAKGARLGALGNTALLDSPFAISGYTEQAARDAQARRLIDVLAVDPAVRSTNSESHAVDVFFLRGLPMLSQDISFNETFAVVDARRIAVEQFERIEVLKGPSALLNGIGPNSSTTGGTINLVPKRGTDVPLTRLTLSGTSHGQMGAHLDAGRRFGPDNQWGVRVNAATRDGGTTGVHDEKVGTDHLSAALDYAGERLRASLDVAQNRRHYDGFPQFMRFNEGFALPSPPLTTHTYSQSWDRSDTKSSAAVSRIEYDLTPDSTVFGVLGGVNYEESNVNAGNPRITSASGNFSAQPSIFKTESQLRSSELGWRTRFATGPVKHRVVLGYSRVTGVGQSLSQPMGRALASNLYNPVFIDQPALPTGGRLLRFQDTKSESLALMDSLHLLDERLHLIAGLRYQKLDIGEFAAGVEQRRFEQSATAPSLGASFKLMPTLSIYANYAEGLSQGPVAPGSTANVGQVFPPFKGKQIETGVKYDAGPFGASASLFQIRQPVSFVNGSNFLVVDGELRNRGLEFSVYGEVAKSVRLNAGLALFDAVQSKTLNGANDGKKAIGVPDYSLVLSGEWDLAPVPGLTLTGRYTKVASQVASANNAQRIPGYDSYDLGLRYATRLAGKATVFRLTVENVADSSHWLAVRTGFLTRSTPRTALFSVSTDF
ncbi:TonB-dependent receptor [Paracidovorax wautersii]|uniref:Iron complex outermembrane receptor protein n=1 Tax=Paracidovorax wautersii TaxID=1177982 RepID=A0ABU1IHK2_9BURK|nr:TonB-dependent receptor [Paracidovorax wautersii]MDR6215908.1 iron complex outermembrane receptor protein [Paracidovorax wautersii]